MKSQFFLKHLFVFIALLLTSTTQANTTKVIVSIQPLAMLVEAVMGETGKPDVLQTKASSPHHYRLNYSQMQRLTDAELIFWIGPNLEQWLVRPLASHQQQDDIIALIDAPSLTLLPYQKGGIWLKNKADNTNEKEDLGYTPDAHIWLDPTNASMLINEIQLRLSKKFPKNQAIYKENANNFKQRLAKLDALTKITFDKLKDNPFISYHNSFQYLVNHYQLNQAGQIMIHEETPPSTKHLLALEKLIRQHNINCLVVSYDAPENRYQHLVNDTQLKPVKLDPSSLTNNNQDFVEYFAKLVNNLATCLLRDTADDM